MSAVGGALIYVVRKAVDIGTDVAKARLLKEHTTGSIPIYGPDGKVVRRVKIESL